MEQEANRFVELDRTAMEKCCILGILNVFILGIARAFSRIVIFVKLKSLEHILLSSEFNQVQILLRGGEESPGLIYGFLAPRSELSRGP